MGQREPLRGRDRQDTGVRLFSVSKNLRAWSFGDLGAPSDAEVSNPAAWRRANPEEIESIERKGLWESGPEEAPHPLGLNAPLKQAQRNPPAFRKI